MSVALKYPRGAVRCDRDLTLLLRVGITARVWDRRTGVKRWIEGR